MLFRSENIDLKLSEQLDNARLLYNKGLKIQSLHILEKAKELAKANQKMNFLVQVISLEKKIETKPNSIHFRKIFSLEIVM